MSHISRFPYIGHTLPEPYQTNHTKNESKSRTHLTGSKNVCQQLNLAWMLTLVTNYVDNDLKMAVTIMSVQNLEKSLL